MGGLLQPTPIAYYELGVKSERLDHRLLLNASVYYYL
jgi:outer membrane receptor for ferric coprogen and ferric-rhodotorulic acid